LLDLALLLVLRPPGTPYLDLLRRGDKFAARSERTAAITAYEEATGWRPNDAEPYLRMAKVAVEWGRMDDAARYVVAAEARGAEAVDVARLRVAISVARAEWATVVEQSQELLRLVPGDMAARHTLARAYVELGEWAAAKATYRELVRMDPSDAVAHERLGVLLAGDAPEAIRHLFSAGTALSSRLIAALGEAGAAENDPYASALLGRVLFEAGEWPLAAYQFERALSQDTAYPDAHAYLGYALDQMGRPAEAEFHLRRAVALAPESPVAHVFLGLHKDRLGDVAGARAEYEIAYDLDPGNPAVCVEIGETWVAERRYDVAEIWLRHAVSLRPDNPALWEVLVRFYVDHGLDAAGQGAMAAAQLVELSPDNARAHDLQGWAAFERGDYGAAQESLLRAISLDPTLASAYYHLGRVWAVQGMHERAQEAFVRALDLDVTGELAPLVERAARE